MTKQGICLAFSFVMALAGSAATCATASAGVYTWTDPQGVTHLSSYRVNAQYQYISSLTPRGPRPALQPAVATTANAAAPQPVAWRHGRARPYAAAVRKAAHEAGVDPALISAVIRVESGFNPRARSSHGAIGLMQLLPSTARRFGVTNLRNPVDNIKAGARYLGFLMHTFNNNMRLAVAAYNAGEGAVIKHGFHVPPFRETLAYVPKVMRYYASYYARAHAPSRYHTLVYASN